MSSFFILGLKAYIFDDGVKAKVNRRALQIKCKERTVVHYTLCYVTSTNCVSGVREGKCE